MPEKIGVMCDNYKVKMFEDEFKKANIEYTKAALTKETTIFTCISEQRIIYRIVNRVTRYFINMYKKNN